MGNASTIDLQRFYPECLKITDINDAEQTLTIHLKSLKHSHCCPNCGLEMTVYHGTYERIIQDLPIFQKKVSLSIKAYEYYCANEACETTTFSEDY